MCVGGVGGGPAEWTHLMGLSRCSSFDNKLSLTLNYLCRRQRSHEKWQRHDENCNDVSNVGGVAQSEVHFGEMREVREELNIITLECRKAKCLSNGNLVCARENDHNFIMGWSKVLN